MKQGKKLNVGIPSKVDLNSSRETKRLAYLWFPISKNAHTFSQTWYYGIISQLNSYTNRIRNYKIAVKFHELRVDRTRRRQRSRDFDTCIIYFYFFFYSFPTLLLAILKNLHFSIKNTICLKVTPSRNKRATTMVKLEPSSWLLFTLPSDFMSITSHIRNKSRSLGSETL